MNKTELIKTLENETNLSYNECAKIANILDNNFVFKKSNKEKIVSSLMEELNVDRENGNKIYEIAINVINLEIKNKLKHPFKSRD